MIISTAAVVLKSIDFQESSRIVTLLTPEHGKFAVLVRGARKPKSKFVGFFEVGNLLDVVVYLKPSRTVQNISEVSYRHRTWNLHQDYAKMAVVMQTMEMLDQLVHDNESSKEFYTLAEKMLPWLNESDNDAPGVFPFIMLRLADLSGIGIQWQSTWTPGEATAIYLNIEDGTISDEPGLGLSYKLTAYQAVYFFYTIAHRNSTIFRNPADRIELRLLIHHLDVYFKHHIDGMRDRKSDAIFEQLL